MSPKPADALAVGRVTGAYGVKGWIKVQPFSLHADALFANTTWWLSASAGAPRLQPLPESVKVLQLREQGDALVAQLEGVNDRNAAEALQGATLNVSRASFPQTDGDDEFYWVDLIGLDVVDRQGKALGQVVDLIDTGPHCVLRIAPPGIARPSPAQEVLIPFLSQYGCDVDLAARRISVDWDESWQDAE
ncbi:ribosome maturation factor RimM [Pseudorhodoferax sp.]|mgnify:FL=1|uniref:ribosome maturation factor RimM n=1 Tax=Pseudorhodoferax sp. TaxID=1993553 RepID=UPI001B78A875|nr:ribosome maturation factor RimM [Pseudorhodoferax sp.]MBP8144176.1 ribosome maturation factor RimM [Inhella sp.]